MAVAITALAFILFLLVWYAYQVMLLAFAGLLLSVFLHGVSVRIHNRLGISYPYSLLLVILTGIIIVAGLVVLIAPRVGEQIDQITSELPKAWEEIQQTLQESRLGRQLLNEGQQAMPKRAEIWSRVAGVFSTTIGGLANLFIILFLGVYMAVNPGLYLGGICALIPHARQGRFTEVLNEVGDALWWWVLGRLFAMSVIAIMTLIGLSIIGVQLALVLSLLAGMLNFIPYIGPMASAIPALLLALPQGGYTVLWVAVLYAFIQTVESYFLTPIVDKQAVRLPPALTITAQLLFGSVAGILGLALASPMTASTIILVRRLYVEDSLGKKDGSEGETACNSMDKGGDHHPDSD